MSKFSRFALRCIVIRYSRDLAAGYRYSCKNEQQKLCDNTIRNKQYKARDPCPGYSINICDTKIQAHWTVLLPDKYCRGINTSMQMPTTWHCHLVNITEAMQIKWFYYFFGPMMWILH